MNVFDQLSNVSGIPRKGMMEIWQRVKANHAALDACIGPHDFSIEVTKVGILVREWGCTKCGGYVPNIERSWYNKGLEHGRVHG